MTRKISLSQFRSQIRQIESQQRQAIARINRAVQQHNQNVRRAVNETNRRIDDYNRAVRTHNANVRSNYNRIRHELTRLQSKTRVTASLTTYRTSTEALNASYTRLLQSATHAPTDSVNELFALGERETANSLELTNILLGDEPSDEAEPDDVDQIAPRLASVSEDLARRWKGAVFALDPRNPDAARHFCTSVRELFVKILDLRAPDTEVLASNQNCPKTPNGTPTRKAKINFLLRGKTKESENMADFVEKDVDNILELFRLFNDGTHGASGTFGVRQLSAIKRRVEDGISFLLHVSA